MKDHELHRLIRGNIFTREANHLKSKKASNFPDEHCIKMSVSRLYIIDFVKKVQGSADQTPFNLYIIDQWKPCSPDQT